MANTTAVYARINTELKEKAENILSQLGISPSSAIQMLYSQIVLTRGFPLNLNLPTEMPINLNNLTQTELNNELKKGIESLNTNKSYTPDEVNNLLKKEFGI